MFHENVGSSCGPRICCQYSFRLLPVVIHDQDDVSVSATGVRQDAQYVHSDEIKGACRRK